MQKHPFSKLSYEENVGVYLIQPKKVMEHRTTNANPKTNTKSEPIPPPKLPSSKDPQLWRDLTAFWLVGICVDYTFHIMLVAANDLLSDNHIPEVYFTFDSTSE